MDISRIIFVYTVDVMRKEIDEHKQTEGKMKYTSTEANKLLKTIEARIEDLKNKEKKSSSFNAAYSEDPEKLRPEYDFHETQAKINKLEADVRTIKYAIHVFNVTHSLQGFDGMKIDQALVYLPQLSARVRKLKDMAAALPRERVEEPYYRSGVIDYVIANYDIAEAEKTYLEEQEKLKNLQLALDAANAGETMEIDITL
jgi:hypothetical protein